MEQANVELSPLLANAIIDMENIAFGEGLGAETEERRKLWEALVIAAERFAGRMAWSHRRKTTISEVEPDGTRCGSTD